MFKPAAFRFLFSRGLFLVIVPLLMAGCFGSSGDVAVDSTLVEVEQGTVAGTTETLPGGGDMLVWRGVAFAEPPVGDLRFRAPQPPVAQEGIIEATEFSPGCLQDPMSPLAIQNSHGLPVSEDCLYLNIQAPAAAGPHPVMVWIHGGALISGSANQSGANPDRLVEEGIVVVTINYRLDTLGYAAHPALTATSDTEPQGSGNYGLMDQQLALQWVQNNIEGFGGDPGNVTIFGESAGGWSVLGLMTMEGSGGLFGRAIIQSGPITGAQPTLETAEQQGASRFSSVCPEEATEAAAQCLREADAEDLLAGLAGLGGGVGLIRRPGVLERNVPEALSDGDFVGAQVMKGTNLDEWRLFEALVQLVPLFVQYGAEIPPEELEELESLDDQIAGDSDAYRSMLISRYGPVNESNADDVVARYPLDDFDTADIAVAAVGTDITFVCPALVNIEQISANVPLYAYEFSDRDAPPLLPVELSDLPLGAAHAVEIPYILDPAETVAATFNPDSAALAEAMVTHWATFARTGNPNPSSGLFPQWDIFLTAGYHELTAPPQNNAPVNVPANHHCDFW